VTFNPNNRLLANSLPATDDEVCDAMRFAHEMFKIVVKPGAAVGIVAVLAGRIDISNRTIATYLTDGNIDLTRFCELIAPT
jgi:threonine dehydratase